jgi:hypothetical protein
MQRFAATALTLGLVMFLGSCSSGSGGGGGGSSAFTPGKWTATLYSTSGGLLANTLELDMDLVQSGDAISSDSQHSVDSGGCTGTHLDSSTGTISGDKFKLTFTIDSETITMTGTLAAGGQSITGGKFTSDGGSCVNGTPIAFNANFVPSLTGNLTGNVGAANATATFTEDANFDITGTINITNDPCLSTLTIAADAPGMSIGAVSMFTAGDGANVVEFAGRVEGIPGNSPYLIESYIVVEGCTEELGEFSFTLGATGSAAARAATAASGENLSRSGASKINPLLVERMRALLAARSHSTE